MGATEPVTFAEALAKAAEILTEASRSTATPDAINAKAALADRWLQLAALIAEYR